MEYDGFYQSKNLQITYMLVRHISQRNWQF